MISTDVELLASALRETVHPLGEGGEGLDPLVEQLGDASVVLLGEATHGTHEFYRLRAELTQRLIAQKGFTAVAVEADWPDTYRVNRFVRDESNDADAEEALRGFRRFPAWMWRNADVLDFVGWLRDHNDRIGAPEKKAGFYGLDLYSLNSSISAVLDYLDRSDPGAAERARRRYACFEQSEDGEGYGYASSLGLSSSCEDEAVAQLLELQRRRVAAGGAQARACFDEAFAAEQNARVVKDAERYYRTMFAGHTQSWNVRDEHMVSTLAALTEHLARRGPSKVVVWAHNSHVGDARATEMHAAGQLNVGQLARSRWGPAVRLVGFSTYSGTVTAASGWGRPAERKRLRDGLSFSCEDVLHRVGLPQFFVLMDELGEASGALRETRLQRAVGVIYLPQTERISHYLHARLPLQFDAVLHIDSTRAVEPLERSSVWEKGEPPETFPSGV